MEIQEENQLTANVVFKGCTRPPMLAGGPLMPMAITLVFGSILLLTSLVFSRRIDNSWPIPVGAAIFLAVVIVYIIIESKSDEHRLNQQLLKIREAFKHPGSTRTYNPITYSKRK